MTRKRRDDEVRFYTTESTFLDDIKKNMPFIDVHFSWIDDLYPYTEILGQHHCEWYPLLYLKKYPGNAYAKLIVNKIKDEKNVVDGNFQDLTKLHKSFKKVSEGLSIHEMNNICKWASLGKRKKTFLFDWMHIIALTYLMVHHTEKNTLSEEYIRIPSIDVAKFVVGTKERFDSLVNMFRILRENRVRIKHVTRIRVFDYSLHNTDKHSFNFFFNALKCIDPGLKKRDNIVIKKSVKELKWLF